MMSLDTPIEKKSRLRAAKNITGTPTLFFTDGQLVPGAIPFARMKIAFSKFDGFLRAHSLIPAVLLKYRYRQFPMPDRPWRSKLISRCE